MKIIAQLFEIQIKYLFFVVLFIILICYFHSDILPNQVIFICKRKKKKEEKSRHFILNIENQITFWFLLQRLHILKKGYQNRWFELLFVFDWQKKKETCETCSQLKLELCYTERKIDKIFQCIFNSFFVCP